MSPLRDTCFVLVVKNSIVDHFFFKWFKIRAILVYFEFRIFWIFNPEWHSGIDYRQKKAGYL